MPPSHTSPCPGICFISIIVVSYAAILWGTGTGKMSAYASKPGENDGKQLQPAEEHLPPCPFRNPNLTSKAFPKQDDGSHIVKMIVENHRKAAITILQVTGDGDEVGVALLPSARYLEVHVDRGYSWRARHGGNPATTLVAEWSSPLDTETSTYTHYVHSCNMTRNMKEPLQPPFIMERELFEGKGRDSTFTNVLQNKTEFGESYFGSPGPGENITSVMPRMGYHDEETNNEPSLRKWGMFSLSIKRGDLCGGPHWESCPQHAPLQVSVQSTLSSLTKNRTEYASFKKIIRCPHCHGSGADAEEHVVTCHACGGHGIIQEAMPLGNCLRWEVIEEDNKTEETKVNPLYSFFGWVGGDHQAELSKNILIENKTISVGDIPTMRQNVTGSRDWFIFEKEHKSVRCTHWKTSQSKTYICPLCGGHGTVAEAGHKCHVCSGKRVIAEPTTVPLPVPPGVYHGYSKVCAVNQPLPCCCLSAQHIIELMVPQTLHEKGSVGARRREANIEIHHVAHQWELAGDFPEDIPKDPIQEAEQLEREKEENGDDGSNLDAMKSIFGQNVKRGKDGGITIGAESELYLDDCGRFRLWHNFSRLENEYGVQTSAIATSLNVSLGEAVTKFRRWIPLPDNRTLLLSHQGVAMPGQTLTLPGAGLPTFPSPPVTTFDTPKITEEAHNLLERYREFTRTSFDTLHSKFSNFSIRYTALREFYSKRQAYFAKMQNLSDVHPLCKFTVSKGMVPLLTDWNGPPAMEVYAFNSSLYAYGAQTQPAPWEFLNTTGIDAYCNMSTITPSPAFYDCLQEFLSTFRISDERSWCPVVRKLKKPFERQKTYGAFYLFGRYLSEYVLHLNETLYWSRKFMLSSEFAPLGKMYDEVLEETIRLQNEMGNSSSNDKREKPKGVTMVNYWITYPPHYNLSLIPPEFFHTRLWEWRIMWSQHVATVLHYYNRCMDILDKGISILEIATELIRQNNVTESSNNNIGKKTSSCVECWPKLLNLTMPEMTEPPSNATLVLPTELGELFGPLRLLLSVHFPSVLDDQARAALKQTFN